MITAAPAQAGSYILSEGPVWDADARRLVWVDIEAGAVLSAPLVERDGRTVVGAVSRTDLGATVGCALPVGDGRMLVALGRALALVGVDGSVVRGSALLPEGRRFNDGKIDPQGRLVVGSLSLSGDDEAADNVLLRLEPHGALTTLDDDLRLSNGLGWSPDGTVMYSIDTEAGRIHRRPYAGGAAGPREVLVELEEGVFADGMTVDAEGALWVAIWGGSGVRVYGPDGALREEGLSIDAPHASSIAFAGPDLDVAVVTSASRDLSAQERRAHPDAGGLFLARPGARGLPATRWVEAPLP